MLSTQGMILAHTPAILLKLIAQLLRSWVRAQFIAVRLLVSASISWILRALVLVLPLRVLLSKRATRWIGSRARMIGWYGEWAVCHHLQRLGWRIVHRNWRAGHLELDLVMGIPERYLLFIEVKTRAHRAQSLDKVVATAKDGFDAVKRATFARTVSRYLRKHEVPLVRGQYRAIHTVLATIDIWSMYSPSCWLDLNFHPVHRIPVSALISQPAPIIWHFVRRAGRF
jgi:Holliday junction resolvase-like predicted endonuclease